MEMCDKTGVEDLSVQDIHDFVTALNDIREQTGREPLTQIEFDACDPNNGFNCLSAHHCFDEMGGYVSTFMVEVETEGEAERLEDLLGARRTRGGIRQYGVPIQESILKVTSVYDSAAGDDGFNNADVLSALRELFVEAGYVNA